MAGEPQMWPTQAGTPCLTSKTIFSTCSEDPGDDAPSVQMLVSAPPHWRCLDTLLVSQLDSSDSADSHMLQMPYHM